MLMRMSAVSFVAVLCAFCDVAPLTAQTPFDPASLPTRAEATDWVEAEMVPYYPLGVFKEPAAAKVPERV